MATKPTAKESKLINDTASILNSIRSIASNGYADTIPIALKAGVDENSKLRSLDSIRSIGTLLNNFPNLMTEFLNLLSRIAFTVIKSANFYNRFSIFKKGYIDYGETIQEIFVSMASVHLYNLDESTNKMLATEESEILSSYHTMNYQVFYKVTVTPYEIKQAFLSYDGVYDLISRIIKSALTAAQYDEYIATKYLIARLALDGKIYCTTIPAITSENARGIAVTLISNAQNMEFLNSEYNIAHVPNGTDVYDQYIIMTPKFNATNSVEVLALSYNMDKAQLIGNTLNIDSFSFNSTELERLAKLNENNPNFVPFTQTELDLLKTIECVQCSKNWFMLFDNLTTQRSFENGEGLYRNFWFHFWKTFSVSEYENAILYSTATANITNLTITPSEVTSGRGQSVAFSASMEGTGFINKEIFWEVSGSGVSTINQLGVLTISPNETESSLTVTATSIGNPSIKASATVTIN